MIHKLSSVTLLALLALNLQACKPASSNTSATKDFGDEESSQPSDGGDADEASKLGSCAQSALCYRSLPGDKYNSTILVSNGLLENLTKAQCEAQKADVTAQVTKSCQDRIKDEIDRRNRNNPYTAVAFDDSQITYEWETAQPEWSANP